MNNSKLIFKPQDWHACTDHDWHSCSKAVNCYSYALNNSGNYWSVPGIGYVKTTPQPFFDIFNVIFKDSTLAQFRKSIIDGAIKDGLIPTEETMNTDEFYVISLYFSNDPKNFDFDWWRQEDSGFWSHKDGWETALNTDSKGNLVTNPLNIIDDTYTEFGGLFLVPRKGIKLTREFPINISVD